MLFTTQRTATATLLALTLSACGGGGGGGGGDNGGGGGLPTTPQASTGFAKEGDTMDDDLNYRANSRGLVTLIDGNAQRQNDPVRVRYSTNRVRNNTNYIERGLIQIDLGDDDIIMLADNNDRRRYVDYVSASEISHMFEVTGEAESGGELIAQTGYLKFTDSASGEISRGFITFGFDTDPDDVAAFNPTSGTATYEGSIDLVASGNSTPAVRNEGTITLTADFDGSREVTGNFSHGSFAGMNSQTYNLTGGSFSGNQISANLVNAGDLSAGQTLESGSLIGNFYGANLDAIGGTVEMTINQNGGDDILVQGGFVAD